MRQGYSEILDNAAQEAEYVSDYVSELIEIPETHKLWRAWSGLLEHYARTVSALRRATDQGQSKHWSDRLKSEQKNDPFLHYAFQSRDSAAHVFEEKREAEPRSVNLGNVVSVGGNSSVTLLNNTVIDGDGRVSKLPDGVLHTEDGRYLGGTITRDEVYEREHFVILKAVRNRSGIWPVPNPSTPPEMQAIEIAKYLESWLQKKLAEAMQMAKDEKLKR